MLEHSLTLGNSLLLTKCIWDWTNTHASGSLDINALHYTATLPLSRGAVAPL